MMRLNFLEMTKFSDTRSWKLHPPHLIPCTQTETKDYIPYKEHPSIYILEKVEGKGEIKTSLKAFSH